MRDVNKPDTAFSESASWDTGDGSILYSSTKSNSGNYELFGWTEVFGLPIEPRDDIPPKRFRVDCPGSAYGIEDELAEAVGEEVSA